MLSSAVTGKTLPLCGPAATVRVAATGTFVEQGHPGARLPRTGQRVLGFGLDEGKVATLRVAVGGKF